MKHKDKCEECEKKGTEECCGGDCDNCQGHCHEEEGGCSGDCDNCSSSGGCGGHCGGGSIPKFQLNNRSHIKKVVAVLSGKGGVGKSMVTSLLAVELARKGYKVGVLDADITGPSMAKTFGIKVPAYQDKGLILPYVTETGIKVISTNMLLENDEDPVLWRGSLICSLIGQFYKDVYWGELDFLLIDMPPGTGDVSLTTFQSIPVDELILVTTPQDLVSMIVKKSLNMAYAMHINVLGIVENMSYVVCPNCDEKIYIYGNKSTEELQKQYGEKILARIPFDGNMTASVDAGLVEDFHQEYTKEAIEELCKILRG